MFLLALKFRDFFKSTKDSYYEYLELLHYKYVYIFKNVYTNDACYALNTGLAFVTKMNKPGFQT